MLHDGENNHGMTFPEQKDSKILYTLAPSFFGTPYREAMCRRVDKILANKTIADTEISVSPQDFFKYQYYE